MYTERNVIRFIRPIAFCVLLLFGAIPAATLACHWACAAPATEHAHHRATHEHGADAPSFLVTPSDAPSVASAEQDCDHAATEITAAATTHVKLVARAATLTAGFAFATRAGVGIAAVAYGAHSPPGSRPPLLSLRI